MIIAHAIFCTLGFLLFLPAGALLARYLRTFIPGPIWFRGHAILQFFIGKPRHFLNPLAKRLCISAAAPTIFIGIMLGVGAVASAHAAHLDDDHKVR